jgi:hypothetical protein
LLLREIAFFRNLFRRAAEAVTYARFSGCDGKSLRLKPFTFWFALAASLKRSPDTSRSSQPHHHRRTTIFPGFSPMA